MRVLFLGAALSLAGALPLSAQEACTLEGEDSTVLAYANALGGDACAAFCSDVVNGCVGWSIRPHDSMPDIIATTCNAFGSVGEKVADEGSLCGVVGE